MTHLSATEQHKILVDILPWRALHQPSQRADTFLVDGEQDQVDITYSELDLQARAIAAWLQEITSLAEPALLLYPSDLDFITAASAFFTLDPSILQLAMMANATEHACL